MVARVLVKVDNQKFTRTVGGESEDVVARVLVKVERQKFTRTTALEISSE